MKPSLLVFAFFLSGASIGQTTDTLRILSSILKEEQEVWITKAGNYDPQKGGPVIICLDGDALHQYTPAFVKYLSVPFEMSVPPMLVVSIRSKSPAWRRRNMTPKLGIDSLDAKDDRGKADELLSFIETELIPHVENKYHSNHFRILAGHSLGGLFTIYTLSKKPLLFRSYIAISPSPLGGVIHQKFLPSILSAKRDSVNYLYFSTAQNDLAGYVEGTQQIKRILDSATHTRLKWKYEYHPDHTHWTTTPPAIYDALLWIFRNKELRYLLK